MILVQNERTVHVSFEKISIATSNRQIHRESFVSAVFWCSFLAGCAAGSTAALSVNPFDVIKTRLQAINKAPGEPTYDGVSDCIG